MPVTSFYKQVVEAFLEGKLQWSFIEHKDAGSQLGYGCTWSHRGYVVQRPAATALSRMLYVRFVQWKLLCCVRLSR